MRNGRSLTLINQSEIRRNESREGPQKGSIEYTAYGEGHQNVIGDIKIKPRHVVPSKNFLLSIFTRGIYEKTPHSYAIDSVQYVYSLLTRARETMN